MGEDLACKLSSSSSVPKRAFAPKNRIDNTGSSSQSRLAPACSVGSRLSLRSFFAAPLFAAPSTLRIRTGRPRLPDLQRARQWSHRQQARTDALEALSSVVERVVKKDQPRPRHVVDAVIGDEDEGDDGNQNGHESELPRGRKEACWGFGDQQHVCRLRTNTYGQPKEAKREQSLAASTRKPTPMEPAEEPSAINPQLHRQRAHQSRQGAPLIAPAVLLPFARDPASRHEIVCVLPRTIKKIVLDVANDRVDAVLESTFLRALAGAEEQKEGMSWLACPSQSRKRLPRVVRLERAGTRVRSTDDVGVVGPNWSHEVSNVPSTSREKLTVAEEMKESRVIVDRLLDAENTNLAQLVVQDPLAQRGLNDVGAIEACEGQISRELQELERRRSTNPCSSFARQKSA